MAHKGTRFKTVAQDEREINKGKIKRGSREGKVNRGKIRNRR